MKKNVSFIVLAVVAVAIVAAIFYLESQKSAGSPGSAVNQPVIISDRQTEAKQQKVKNYDSAKEIVAPAGFINTAGKEITIQELIGKKVILVDFWTYSCINCQRTLPYLTSWYEKYRDQGLEIVGIHTPEFEFEKDIDNVKRAVDKWGIEYPVVLDNDYGTWQNYRNRYWPHKFLIDIDGFIVYDHIGEGAYAQTEKKIQEVLAERMAVLGKDQIIDTGIVQPAAAEDVDLGLPRSPEIYFGAWRNEYLGNGIQNQAGIQNFSAPTKPKLNILYLDGEWDIQHQFSQNLAARDKIIFKYRAEKVFLVASADQAVKLTLILDGQPISDASGSDVINSQVTVNEDRLYRLVEDPQGWGEHILEIIIESPGLQAFTFTFG